MNTILETLIWIVISFLCGSLPLSYWLGRLALRKDIRQYGDGNPGAANVFEAGGRWLGFIAILLDGFKGLIPVAYANFVVGIEGWGLAAVTVAPMFGHAFSPFLRFKGGKAIAVTFGAWTGLTSYVVPFVLGGALIFWVLALSSGAWAILIAYLTLLTCMLVWFPEPVWLAVWVVSFGLLIWKHWDGLQHKPQLKVKWFKRQARRS